MHGVLVIDKPSGPSSHDVVERVRRAIHVRRVGHTGTLDPIATGVLPIVVGRATRLASLLAAGTKCYEAVIRLGVVTDTYDVTGRIIQSSGCESQGAGGDDVGLRTQHPVLSAQDPAPGSVQRAVRSAFGTAAPTDARLPWSAHLDHERLDELRRAFLGTFRQQPPPFSAKKVGGVRAYRLARRQRAVAISPAEVTVHQLDLWPIDRTGLGCRVICSPGFYVRALAHDLGERLGCGACLEALRRERSGAFGVESALPLAVLEAEGLAALGRITPLEALLPELPGLVLTARGARRAAHGNPVSPDDVAAASPREAPAVSGAPDGGVSARVKLFDADGKLVAIAEPVGERFLHPTIVLV